MNVEGPDGAVIAFPDGTPPESIKAAMQKKYGVRTPDRTREFAKEVMGADPLGGLGPGVRQGVTEGARNVAQSVIGPATAVGHAVMHPIETAQSIAGGAEQAISHPIDTAKAVGQAALGAIPMKDTASGLLNYAQGSGAPPSVQTVAREGTELMGSQLLGGVIPAAAKGAAKSFIRELPGSVVELHSLAIPAAEGVAESLRPTAGMKDAAYAKLKELGNPKLDMSTFRAEVQQQLRRETNRANPDTSLINDLNGYLQSTKNGWHFDQVKDEAQLLGDKMGNIHSTGGGATAMGATRAISRHEREQLSRLFKAAHEDVDAGRMSVEGRYALGGEPPTGRELPPSAAKTAGDVEMDRVGGPGLGPATEQSAALSQAWKDANKLARRDFAASGLRRMIDGAASVTGDQFDTFSLNQVVRELRKAQRAASYDSQAKLFVNSFEPGEVNQIIGSLKEVAGNLPKMTAIRGTPTGTSQRFTRAAVGSGIGHLLGVDPVTSTAMTLAGTELIAQGMMSDPWRALVRTAMKIDPTVGPVFKNIMAGYLRTQMPEPKGSPQTGPAPVPGSAPATAPTPPPNPQEALVDQQRDAATH